VVHDIGGPVGFELATARPERVASLTIFNTMVAVGSFRPPWPMRPFRRRVLGELWMAALTRPMVRALLRRQGIADRGATTDAELDAYGIFRRRTRPRRWLTTSRGSSLATVAGPPRTEQLSAILIRPRSNCD